MNYPQGIRRRDFLKMGLGASAALALRAPGPDAIRVQGKTSSRGKVLILGIDGLDAHLLRALMDDGKLPAFRKLAGQGGFRPLLSSIPPQSPVAWSNFMIGADPGTHGIFDFLGRNPEDYGIIFTATESLGAKRTIRLGSLVLPLSGGEVRNKIQGRAFWQVLEENDIPATVFKIPSNYPPVKTRQRTLAGLGTPDIKGYYGLFNYYTNESKAITSQAGGGGRAHEVYVIGNRVESSIPGPENTFRKDAPETSIDFQVFIDPVSPVAKIVVQDEEFILKEKEWSGWKRVRFGLIPTQGVQGICMFYLKEVRPKFKLYISPIHIDPANPILPISTPESYSRELEKKFGPFFTKGLPADTSALDNGVLDENEYLELEAMIFEESRAMLDYELDRLDSGLLFYYFSNADQKQHMFWRLIDPQHPSYDPALAGKYGRTIENTYAEMDSVLASVLGRLDRETTVIVMSDHGFTTFRRAFNLNTWLKDNGYHRLVKDWKQEESSLYDNTDWFRTKAFGVGLNGLCVNQKGREREGIVPAGPDKDNLVREIARKLEETVDPKTGERIIHRAYVTGDIYKGPCLSAAPDIILGFNRGYRIGWQSAMGSFPRQVVEDNTAKWSGDHMTAPELIPGVLLANRPIPASAPALFDVTASLLDVLGVEKPKDMTGKTVFK